VDGTELHRADCADFQAMRSNRIAAILSYDEENTATNLHWGPYQNTSERLAIGVEHVCG
jgi:hypothetical protein